MYTPKRTKARPIASTMPLRDSVNQLFDIAIAAIDKTDREQGRKLSFVLRKQDEELKAQQLWEKFNTCPSCRLTLTTTGFCGECDYVKPKGTCRSCAYNQENICLNRSGSEGTKNKLEHLLDRCDNWAKL